MRSICRIVAALFLLVWPGGVLAGSSVRYALVVGNNHVQTPPGVLLPDLKHAEDEARRLHRHLIRLSNFDTSEERSVLLTGANRQEIIEAARRLAERHRLDRQSLGEVPTLFAFFYTGHGLEGKLLTSGEPLTGDDLAMIFRTMDATFTVGVFDACFSGSLDLDKLKAKGLRPTPGFNLFSELPREVLNSKGTMWFASSRHDQVSYEDDRLGGVFTHFFMEAMEQASSDDIGVSLEEIWEYTRSHTQLYTSRAGRPQTPQKMIRNLTTVGPLYFSFPRPRDATLLFEEGIEGRFLVRYEAGQLTELITKQAGRTQQVAMYPGEIVLERLQAQGREWQRVRLEPKGLVTIREREGWVAERRIGFREESLLAKGNALEGLVITRRVPKYSGLMELSYRLALGSDFSDVSVHNAVVGLRLDHGLLSGLLGFSYGRSTGDYEAWGYSMNRYELRAELGVGLDLGPVRLTPFGLASLFLSEVDYRNGSASSWGGFSLGAGCALLVPLLRDPFGLHLVVRAAIAAERSRPVAPAGSAAEWQAVPTLGLGLAVELF